MAVQQVMSASVTEPAKPDHAPTTQCGRIIRILKAKGSVTNAELNRMGIFRYSARIKDLRDEEWNITTNHLREGLWEFVWDDYEAAS